jgi:hypothetical protein
VPGGANHKIVYCKKKVAVQRQLKLEPDAGLLKTGKGYICIECDEKAETATEIHKKSIGVITK